MLFALGFLLVVRDRRRHGRDAGVARRSTSTSPTRTSSSPTSTTCCSAARSSRCSPASTTGSRSSPVAGCTRAGQGPVLDDVRRLQPDVLRAARPRHATACPGGSPTTRRPTGFATLNLVSTIGAFILGGVDAAVPVERLAHAAPGRAGRRRPVGRGTRSSGRRPRPRRPATSPTRCRRSAPSGRCGTPAGPPRRSREHRSRRGGLGASACASSWPSPPSSCCWRSSTPPPRTASGRGPPCWPCPPGSACSPAGSSSWSNAGAVYDRKLDPADYEDREACSCPTPASAPSGSAPASC